MQRGMDYYKKKGYSDEWIYQRLLSIKIRHELTTNRIRYMYCTNQESECIDS